MEYLGVVTTHCVAGFGDTCGDAWSSYSICRGFLGLLSAVQVATRLSRLTCPEASIVGVLR